MTGHAGRSFTGRRGAPRKPSEENRSAMTGPIPRELVAEPGIEPGRSAYETDRRIHLSLQERFAARWMDSLHTSASSEASGVEYRSPAARQNRTGGPARLLAFCGSRQVFSPTARPPENVENVKEQTARSGDGSTATLRAAVRTVIQWLDGLPAWPGPEGQAEAADKVSPCGRLTAAYGVRQEKICNACKNACCGPSPAARTTMLAAPKMLAQHPCNAC